MWAERVGYRSLIFGDEKIFYTFQKGRRRHLLVVSKKTMLS